MASASEIQNILQYLDPQLHVPMMEFAKKAGFEVTPAAAPQTPSKADVATATAAEITKAGAAISTHFTCEGGVYAFIKPTEETAAPSKAHTAAIANLAKLAYIDGSFVNACAFFACLVHFNPAVEQDTYYWGYLVCAIRAEQWDVALKVVLALEGALEDHHTTPRVWLWHASLFVAFHGGKHRAISEVIFQVEKQKDYNTRNNVSLYHNRDVLEMVAPHYWRYIAAATFLAADGRGSIQNICKFLRTLSGVPQDPLVRVGHAIWVERNAVAALELLDEVSATLKSDFFLASVADAILDSVYKQVFDSYILSHKKVSLKLVAERTHQKIEDAEAWVVRLLEDKNYIKAKMDSAKQEIEIVTVRGDAYSRVLREVSKGGHGQKAGYKSGGYNKYPRKA